LSPLGFLAILLWIPLLSLQGQCLLSSTPQQVEH
jgi:hypothetical protein